MSDSGHVGPGGGADRAASSDRSSQLGSARPGRAGRGPDRPGERRTPRAPAGAPADSGDGVAGVGPADPAGTRDQPGALDEGGAAEQTVDLDRPDPPTRSDPGAPTRGHDTDEVGRAEPADTSHTPFTQQVGRVVLVLLAVLFGVFAVANSQRVDFSWVFGATEVQRNSAGEVVSGGVPLIVLLIVSLVIGIAVGMLTMWLLHRRRR